MKYKLDSIQTIIQEAEKHGKSWKVILIEEGLSKNGKFYPADVLKNAVRLFDKAKAFIYEWKDGEFNHLPPAIQRMRPEGFPHQIAGWYSDPKFEEINVEGQKKRAITAVLHIHEGAKWLSKMLKDAWMNGMRKLLGLSIDAEGDTGTQIINGRPLEVVTAIKRVFGIDLVTHPAAGGQLVRLLASKMKGEGNMDRKKIIEMIKKLRPELLEGVNVDELQDLDLEALLEKAIKEEETEPSELTKRARAVGLPDDASQEEVEKAEIAIKSKADQAQAEEEKKIDEAIKEAVDKVAAKAKEEGKSEEEIKELTEAEKGAATLNQVIGLLKAKKFALALNILQKWLSQYPKGPAADKKGKAYPYKKEAEALLQRITAMDEKLAIVECNKVLDKMLNESKLPDIVKKKVEKKFKDKKFESSQLQETIKEETEVLADLTSQGDVDLGEFSDIKVGRSGQDRLQAACDLMLDPKIDDNEKDKYEGIKGFKSLREAYVKVTGDAGITGVIPPKRLQEATTADFSYILGNTIGRKMAKDYKLTPAMWRDLADVVPVKDFRTQEIIRWGGFANLETVSESDSADTYGAMAFPGDEEATYAATTKGGIVTITRKMIINDDLRSLQKLPTKISRAAVRTLNQFVFDLLLNYGSNTINGGTIYDGIALYIARHFNLGTAALDYDSFGDAIDRMREQKETGYQANLNDDPLNSTDLDFDLDSAAIAANYKVGDYVLMDAEFIGPITVVATANVTVAARGIWGSTAASHLTDTKVKIVTDDLMLEPGILWVPTDLRTMGEAILKSEFVDDTLSNRNPYKGVCELRVVPRRYLRGDVNNWYITAKKADVELIELGFLGGKEEPELLRQDAPGVGLVFTRDVIRYKVRHEYGGAVIDYRGFQGNTVSG